jgi:hypothetical protein
MSAATCGTKEAECVCVLEPGHDTKWHRCDCGGEWAQSDEHGFEIKTLPGPFGAYTSQFIGDPA